MNEKVPRLLKNYRSYRFAAKNGDLYSNTSKSYGVVRVASGRGDILIGLNEWDHRRYTLITALIDDAISEVLNDEEQTVIKYKYTERNTLNLQQIAETKLHCHEQRAKYLHKKALNKLDKALVFVEDEEIINLDRMLDKTCNQMMA